ncbi:MAG TPA: helix-turn-helix transcriptional regulator [Aequorivita sp.]|nr:helix-turn-helix transcriptional regulator [Aequorivita sp.]
MDSEYDISRQRNDFVYDHKADWGELKKHAICSCQKAKHLVVIIFDIRRDRFLGISDSFLSILGHESKCLTEKGWDFWFSLIDYQELEIIKNRISDFLANPRVMDNSAIFLEYHLRSSSGKWLFLKHELELRKFNNDLIAFNYICDYSAKENVAHGFLSSQTSYANHRLDPTKISSREYEVLQLISNGLSSKQIGHSLFISYNTVISHRQHLLEKFKVQNTAQLIKEASSIFRL